ncbi:hypothetical protein ABN254_21435, partial [Providencia rettgeri]
DAGESHGEDDVAAALVGERCLPSIISPGSRRKREGERGMEFAVGAVKILHGCLLLIEREPRDRETRIQSEGELLSVHHAIAN